jgi:hypothetical protein
MLIKIFTFTALGCLLRRERIPRIRFILVVNHAGATLKENVEEIPGLLVVLSPELDSLGIGVGKPFGYKEQLKICHRTRRERVLPTSVSILCWSSALSSRFSFFCSAVSGAHGGAGWRARGALTAWRVFVVVGIGICGKREELRTFRFFLRP